MQPLGLPRVLRKLRRLTKRPEWRGQGANKPRFAREISGSMWVDMAAELGRHGRGGWWERSGRQARHRHEADGVDARADKGITSADHSRFHPPAPTISNSLTTGSRRGFVPALGGFGPRFAGFVPAWAGGVSRSTRRPRAAAAKTPPSLPRRLRPESSPAAGRHGAGDRQRHRSGQRRVVFPSPSGRTPR